MALGALVDLERRYGFPTWVQDRIAPLGAPRTRPCGTWRRGAIMAIEDGWVFAEHVHRQRIAGESTGRACQSFCVSRPISLLSVVGSTGVG